MNVDLYNFVSALNCVLAQRLVRKICTHCKRECRVPDHILEDSGLEPDRYRDFTFFEGAGCIECNGTGFRGRLAIAELLNLSDNIRQLIIDRRSAAEIKRAAKAEGIDKEPAIKTRLEYGRTEYLAREYFRRRLAKKPLVTEQELKDYYKTHIDEFKPPMEIKARHILLRTEAEAKKVLAEIKAGKDFAELAKKYSIDPAAAKGGRLELQDGKEWLPRGTFEQSFEHVLFNIPKGEVGGPIKTQFGWHILKVEDVRQPETRSFVQVRGLIKNRLEDQKRAQPHKKITEELKKKIPVIIK
jgi:parvulin-like peptidyl-prolyl isomerase